jgi:hypothetical protein
VRRIRFKSVLIGAALLALAGCGSGGGNSASNAGEASSPPPTQSVAATVPTTTPTVTAAPPTNTAPAPTSTSPEDKPGGAGDETPIGTQALFEGKDGTIKPDTIRVPPFIAVNVVLHSADGGSYGIEVAHHQLSVDASHPRATVQLSGLRAGKRYTVDVAGAPETLAIVANAEPGP